MEPTRVLTVKELWAKYNAVIHPIDRKSGFVSCAEDLWAKYIIALRVAPETIVELGVRCGYSAWALLVGAPSAKYLGFDSYLLEHANVKGVPNAQRLFKAHAEEILAAHSADITAVNTQDADFSVPRAELYHVDAAHSYVCAKRDIVNCVEAGDEHSVIIVHDFLYLPIREAVLDVAKQAEPRLAVWEIPEPRNGAGVILHCEIPDWLTEIGAQQLL